MENKSTDMEQKFVINKVIRKKIEINEVKSEVKGLIFRAIIITVGIWVLFFYAFGFTLVRGQGMYPRISDGDLLFLYRLETNFSIGDVLSFKKEGKQELGRIVAMQGDTIEFSEDGQLLINGNPQQEEIFFASTTQGRDTTYPYQVKEGEVFVLGDNRPYAIDSRDFGGVNLQEIDGVVLCEFRNRGI